MYFDVFFLSITLLLTTHLAYRENMFYQIKDWNWVKKIYFKVLEFFSLSWTFCCFLAGTSEKNSEINLLSIKLVMISDTT